MNVSIRRSEDSSTLSSSRNGVARIGNTPANRAMVVAIGIARWRFAVAIQPRPSSAATPLR